MSLQFSAREVVLLYVMDSLVFLSLYLMFHQEYYDDEDVESERHLKSRKEECTFVGYTHWISQ